MAAASHNWRLAAIDRASTTEQVLRELREAIIETRMLLRHHPAYPWSDYVSDHERLFDAIEQRDHRAPEYAVEHLRLSARLIAEELDRASGDAAVGGGDDPA